MMRKSGWYLGKGRSAFCTFAIFAIATATAAPAWPSDISPSLESIPTRAELVQAVQRSSSNYKAPASSSPSLLNPLQEFTSVNPDNRNVDRTGCNAHSASVPNAPEINCALGDLQSTNAVILIGDSNALMWTAGLDSFGFANRVKVIYLTHPGCSPWSRPWVPQAAIVSTSVSEAECGLWRKAAIAKAKSLNPKLIVPVGIDLSTPYSAPKGELEKALSSLVSSLGPSRTLFLEPPPKYPLISSSTGCASARPTSLNLCEMQRKNVSLNPVDIALKATSTKLKVPIVGTIDYFCGPVYCPIFVSVKSKTMLVYADGFHVTKLYSQLLGKSLDILRYIK